MVLLYYYEYIKILSKAHLETSTDELKVTENYNYKFLSHMYVNT